MKLPRYVRALNNSLYYQRDYPTKLKPLIGKKTFTYPMGLRASGASEAAMHKAISTATETYELNIKIAANSEPSAYNLKELDLAALALLKSRRLQPAEFSVDRRDPAVVEHERVNQIHADQDNISLAEFALPEFEEVLYKQGTGQPLTIKDKVVGHAWLKLVDVARSKPQSLSQLWDEYAADKGIDLDSREGKRQVTHWNDWLAVTGEVATSTPNALDHIHNGLDAFVEEQRKRGLKGQSIKRGLAQVLACLRRGSKKYRLGWVIEPPHIKQDSVKRKQVLTLQEQRDLIDCCLNSPKQDYRHRRSAAAILVMLQGGCMTSEISRLLHGEDVALGASIPHILIKNDTKTDDRKRVIPIVLGLEYIQQNLDLSTRWLASVEDSSAVIKKFLTRATGNNALTGHCLRHTFRANAQNNGANLGAVAAIGGWSGDKTGISDIMLGYGAEGLSSGEGLKGLLRESKVIHKHLLPRSSLPQRPLRLPHGADQ